MKYLNAILSFLFLFFVTSSMLIAQEKTEKPKETPQEVEEPVTTEQEAPEAVEEEEAPEPLQQAVQEEPEERPRLAGFTAGLNVGLPIITGQFMSNMGKDPNFGVIAGTPYGFSVGPLGFGVGVEILTYSFSKKGNSPDDFSGLAILGTVNADVTQLLPFQVPGGRLAFQGGGGYFGNSLGITAGGSFDYAIPNLPLLVRAYARGNATLAQGEGGPGGGNDPIGWISVGAYLSYDISTLF